MFSYPVGGQVFPNSWVVYFDLSHRAQTAKTLICADSRKSAKSVQLFHRFFCTRSAQKMHSFCNADKSICSLGSPTPPNLAKRFGACIFLEQFYPEYWQKRLAKGWRKVGEGLAKGWQRVGGLQLCNSRGACLEDRVCDSIHGNLLTGNAYEKKLSEN